MITQNELNIVAGRNYEFWQSGFFLGMIIGMVSFAIGGVVALLWT